MDPGGTDWSEWAWDYSQNCWYRARKDAQGLVHYDFQAAQTAPRGNVDDLANSLSNVNLGIHQGTHYTQDGAYTYGAPVPVEGAAAAGMYGTSSAQAAHSAFSAKGQGRSADSHSKHRSRDKPSSKKQRPRTAKTGSYEDSENPTPAHMAPFYKRTGTASGSDYPSASDAGPGIHQEYADTYESSHESTYASGFSQGSGSSQPYRQEPPAELDAEAEPSSSGTVPPTSDAAEYPDAAGEDDTRRYSTGQESVASDTSGELLHDALLQAEADPYHTGDLGSPYSGGESSSMAVAQSHHMYPPSEADNGRETPRPPFSQRPTISTTETEDYQHQINGTESITSGQEPGSQDGYVVERSSRFQPGEVFKIFWCEPLGAGPPKSEVMTHQVRFEQNGRSFYQGLRRFIVVANDEGHCTCVPILTYEHQACRKRGVKPLKHGIIYQSGKRPKKLDGEPQLGFEPVCVNLYERTERLVKESRVNYAKLTTIEHNFPVFFIGSIDPADFHNVVRPAVDTCWEKKKRHASNY